jgi:hypothetical protein
MKKKPTIDELQKILESEEDRDIIIRPDGSITTRKKKKKEKLLTMREDLGGEYAAIQ